MSLFTLVRRLNPLPSPTNFIVSKTETSHFLIFPFQETFRIYDCRKLNVIFQGPIVPKYKNMALCNDHLIIAGENGIMQFYYRSVLKMSISIETDELISFDNFFIVRFRNDIKFYEFNIMKEPVLLRRINRENVGIIYHVPNYINKILICTNDGVEIYNFMRDKIIFKSGIIKGSKIIEASPILDIIAIATVDSIFLFDLKKDKILFSINYSGVLSRMSFHSNDQPLLIAVIDNELNLFHLEEQRWIAKLEKDVLDASFLEGEDLIAVKRKDSIRLYVYENYKIRLLKERTLIGSVNTLEEFNENLILSTGDGIYSASLIRDELNFRFKVSGNIKPETIKIGLENIVAFNDSKILLLSHENKNSEIVMESYKDMFVDIEISNCGNFGVLRTKEKIIIHNLKSKMIYKQVPIEEGAIGMAFDIFIKKIIICYKSKILIINDDYTEENIVLDLEIEKFRYKNNFCGFITKECVILYDLSNKIMSRIFLAKNAINFSISNDFSLISVITEESICVFDIRTQKLVCNINCKSSSTIFTSSSRYLCVLVNGNVDLYFNNSIFEEILALPIINEDLVETKLTLDNLEDKLRYNFIGVQKEMNNLLLSGDLTEEQKSIFREEYEIWAKKYEDAVAYIEFEKKRNIF